VPTGRQWGDLVTFAEVQVLVYDPSRPLPAVYGSPVLLDCLWGRLLLLQCTSWSFPVVPGMPAVQVLVYAPFQASASSVWVHLYCWTASGDACANLWGCLGEWMPWVCAVAGLGGVF